METEVDTGTGLSYRLVENWEQRPDGIEHGDVCDIATDSQGRVYLVTRREPRVLVYQPDGTFISLFADGQLSYRPHAITIGPDDAIYVVDEPDQTVKVFDTEGKLQHVIGTSGQASDSGIDWDIQDSKARQESIVRAAPPFHNPTKLAVAPWGELYVSDGYGNAALHRFDKDGKHLQTWGGAGTEPGQFRLPHSVLATTDERVLVADREGDRIQVFSPSGEFLEQWTDVQRPTALVEADGRIYVTELPWMPGDYSWRRGEISEREPARLSIYDLSGKLLLRQSTTGDHEAPGNLAAPHGIAVDADGNLYIGEVTWSFLVGRGLASDGCHTIQKFERQ
jgi:DNA-binding beta-propeller fold protein YncE